MPARSKGRLQFPGVLRIVRVVFERVWVLIAQVLASLTSGRPKLAGEAEMIAHTRLLRV